MSRTAKLTAEQARVLYNIMFAEVGGGPADEVAAVASTFLNNVDTKGFDKAAGMSSAYKRKSPQYTIADTGAWQRNPVETKAFIRNKQIVDNLLTNPQMRQPWTNFENVNAYSEPYWSKGVNNFQDIGRQRFYVIPTKPRVKAVNTLTGESQ